MRVVLLGILLAIAGCGGESNTATTGKTATTEPNDYDAFVKRFGEPGTVREMRMAVQGQQMKMASWPKKKVYAIFWSVNGEAYRPKTYAKWGMGKDKNGEIDFAEFERLMAK